MANPFGEIAANIGKEVAEGVAKKATMKAKELIKLIPSEYKSGESASMMWKRVSKETDPTLINSIKSEGIKEPVKVSNGVIVDGHHRIYASNLRAQRTLACSSKRARISITAKTCLPASAASIKASTMGESPDVL